MSLGPNDYESVSRRAAEASFEADTEAVMDFLSSDSSRSVFYFLALFNHYFPDVTSILFFCHMSHLCVRYLFELFLLNSSLI
jgi:hypothetical protein